MGWFEFILGLAIMALSFLATLGFVAALSNGRWWLALGSGLVAALCFTVWFASLAAGPP